MLCGPNSNPEKTNGCFKKKYHIVLTSSWSFQSVDTHLICLHVHPTYDTKTSGNDQRTRMLLLPSHSEAMLYRWLFEDTMFQYTHSTLTTKSSQNSSTNRNTYRGIRRGKKHGRNFAVTCKTSYSVTDN